jgi:hypothetical protein
LTVNTKNTLNSSELPTPVSFVDFDVEMYYSPCEPVDPEMKLKTWSRGERKGWKTAFKGALKGIFHSR